jgi:uncharacterized protein (DUF1778 family)
MKRAQAARSAGDKKTTVTSIRVGHEDHETIRRAARIERRSVTSFVLYHALLAARQVIATEEGGGVR